MKTIEYKKRYSPKRHLKIISINENNENKDCRTRVHKSFVYLVSEGSQGISSEDDSQIYIRKDFDSKKNEEKCWFKIKGAFYIKRGRDTFKINFCHVLRISIFWKYKVFSPQKSATLT